MHGGLSPELSQMEQIANIARPCDVPDTGLLCDILWADPDPSITVGTTKIRPRGFLCLETLSRLRLPHRRVNRVGEKTIVAFPLHLVAMLSASSFAGMI